MDEYLVEEDALSVDDALAAVDGYSIQFHGQQAQITHDPDGQFTLDDIMERVRDALLSGLVVTVKEGGAS